MIAAQGRFWCVIVDGQLISVAFGFTSRQARRRALEKLQLIETFLAGRE